MFHQKSYLLLATTSGLAFLLTPSVAAAQDAPPAAEQTADLPDAEEAIVVTGLRRSLESAQAVKRDSDQIIDSIVAEDIGKLPDVTAAESLARITGIQVDRSGGEAAGVRLRGLPDLATTYNG
ncbi:MAG TPA: TonB-dependent receptor plug domain-containing protein, partial [Sphingomonas sp.]|nr:TonB-dependent receptor plug domain-containing protein [Sphingomonas sp.]